MSLQSKAAAVRLILFDVDGVLTDGRVLVHADGS
jgi:3-deoxy-D-manno-octulosonate 8-phosphate phosphatase KdsC-like HAD superfamily phosphatase